MTVLLTAPVRTAAPPVFDLDTHGGRTALWTPDGEISYAELSRRAGDLADETLGDTRRLVLVEGANRPESVVAYLAALQHGHVALLVPDGRAAHLEEMVAAYDPDVVLRTGAGRDGRGEAIVRREGSAHDLHPDLALLLSTSGSTGSPKLVRLSRDNVLSNAAAIASYLHLTPADRAATSLPLHYCYGLSVLNSHLVAGAGVAADGPLGRGRVLLGPLPHGGGHVVRRRPLHLRPARLARASRTGTCPRCATSPRPGDGSRPSGCAGTPGWAAATAGTWSSCTARPRRPPGWPTCRPSSPRPGRRRSACPSPVARSALEPVADCPEPGAGELVYRGPNVMMGYAERPADLAEGATLTELRTGDLARCSRRPLRDRRTPQPARQAVRAAARPRPGRERLASAHAPVRCVVEGDALHAFTTRPRAVTDPA